MAKKSDGDSADIGRARTWNSKVGGRDERLASAIMAGPITAETITAGTITAAGGWSVPHDAETDWSAPYFDETEVTIYREGDEVVYKGTAMRVKRVDDPPTEKQLAYLESLHMSLTRCCTSVTGLLDTVKKLDRYSAESGGVAAGPGEVHLRDLVLLVDDFLEVYVKISREWGAKDELTKGSASNLIDASLTAIRTGGKILKIIGAVQTSLDTVSDKEIGL